jgi:hypothetical protein
LQIMAKPNYKFSSTKWECIPSNQVQPCRCTLGGTGTRNHADWSMVVKCIYKISKKKNKEFTFDVSQKMLTMQQVRHTPTYATNSSKNEYGRCANLMLSN